MTGRHPRRPADPPDPPSVTVPHTARKEVVSAAYGAEVPEKVSGVLESAALTRCGEEVPILGIHVCPAEQEERPP